MVTRKALAKAVLASILGGIMLLVAGTAWLVGTEPGTRWLLRAIDRYSPATLEWDEVRGRLAGNLEVTGLRLSLAGGGGLVAREAALHWRPEGLLRGRVTVESLKLEEGFLELPGEAGARDPAPLEWPLVEGWPLGLSMEIGRVAIREFSLRSPGAAPRKVDAFQGRLSWENGVLALEEFELRLPEGGLSGTIRGGLGRPSLQANLEGAWVADETTWRGSLDLDLPPASRGASSHLHFRVNDEEGPLLEISAQPVLTERGISLGALRVRRPGHPGEVTGRAAMDWGRGEPRWEMQVDLSGLILQADREAGPTLSGSLDLTGTGRGYEGDVSLRLAGKEAWQDARLAGRVAGDENALAVEALQGDWLGGSLGGNLGIAWSGSPVLNAELRLRGVDPERAVAAWPGRINLDLEADLAMEEGGDWRLDLRGRLLESRLRGEPLRGRWSLLWSGDDLLVRELEIRGESILVTGQGSLARRLAIDAEVSDLGGILPGTAGQVRAAGWFRYREETLAGDFQLSGDEVRLEGMAVESLIVDLRGGEAGSRLQVSARAENLEVRGRSFRDLELEAAGTLGEHRAELRLRDPSLRALAQLRGGYRRGRWEGALERLDLRPETEEAWRLQQPAPAAVSAEGFSLGPVALTSTGGELWLEIASGDRFRQGRLDSRWESLDLSLLRRWLSPTGWSIEGRSTGRLEAEWATGTLHLEGRMATRGVLTGPGAFSLDVTGLDLAGKWDQGGLEATLDLDLGTGGGVRATVTSTQPGEVGLPGAGRWEVAWEDLDPAPAYPFLGEWRPAGELSGRSTGSWSPAGLRRLVLESRFAGSLSRGKARWELPEVAADLSWDAAGFRAEGMLLSAAEGRFGVSLRSGESPGWRLPGQGTLEAFGDGFDLAILEGVLPPGLGLQGTLSGDAEGGWAGESFDVAGAVRVEGGELSWRGEDESFLSPVRKAELTWTWRHDALEGTAEVVLGDYGLLQATGRLPIPARLPLEPLQDGPLEIRTEGRLRERGLLAALLPGLVQETRGRVELDLSAEGTWGDPRWAGEVTLAGAGAYVPALGVRLEQTEVDLRLAGDRLILERLFIVSGDGALEGSGEIALERWRPAGVSLTLEGEDFQAVNLPGFTVRVSPDLRVAGTMDQLQVRGDLLVPEFLLVRTQEQPAMRQHPDVVLHGAEPEPETPWPATDLEVRLILGDRVLVKLGGVDAKFAGEVLLSRYGEGPVQGKGEIRVVEGSYSRYGIKLKIARGRVLFPGGPVDRPTLDILALRRVRDVEAGVLITGTPRQPEISLYSDPPMADTDRLSYIVLGRPLAASGGQVDLLGAAAGALLSQGESVVLQDRLQQTFGVDEISIGAGEGDVAQSVVTLGKYLGPKLYVSFGQSLFTPASELRVRYSLTDHWEVETKVSEESAADLFYKIEFD